MHGRKRNGSRSNSIVLLYGFSAVFADARITLLWRGFLVLKRYYHGCRGCLVRLERGTQVSKVSGILINKLSMFPFSVL